MGSIFLLKKCLHSEKLVVVCCVMVPLSLLNKMYFVLLKLELLKRCHTNYEIANRLSWEKVIFLAEGKLALISI